MKYVGVGEHVKEMVVWNGIGIEIEMFTCELEYDACQGDY
jgi:hypothetical protein|nr:MAG: hypothetical protein [Bacteriophage sp.]UVY37797.1 MAG: hypothetical protein [Bacteriophage sp.]